MSAFSSLPEKPNKQHSWLLGENFSAVSSYLAPGMFQQNYPQNLEKTRALASKILKDPLLKIKLCDRVYELMLEDMSRQKERRDHYRGEY